MHDEQTRSDGSRPELLAPAGDWTALRAAVANGADAVYFGLSNFNARHRAHNFTLEELPGVMEFLRARRVRGYVTFNTLIFSDELEEAQRFLEQISAAGVDAIIVQDLGLAALARRVVPGLAVHGSTQMSLTEARGIEWVRQLGVERVIVARELGVAEIGQIAQETSMPLEVFVHGALCVAYSGQCLTSEALGGRSANRGQCGQACRLPYDLWVDGEPRELGDKAYLLSPKDLAAYDLIEELVGAGVVSLKIEGRLKSAEYVAMTTKTYRAAIEACQDQQRFELDPQAERDLAQSFSRGFSHGFLAGIDHQELVEGRFPKSRGVKLGRVVAKTAQGVVVEFESRHTDLPVRPGDGVVFDQGHPEQDEQGGRVFEIEPTKTRPSEPLRAELRLMRGSVSLPAIEVGALVWKTDDPELRRRMQRTFADDRPQRRRKISLTVHGSVGGALIVVAREAEGRTATAEWAGPLQRALKHPLTPELVREQFGRLGETMFELGEVELLSSDPVMVPKSVLNELRRQLTEQLRQTIHEQSAHAVVEPAALSTWRTAIRAAPERDDASANFDCDAAAPQLHVLVRTLAQLEAVLAWQPEATLARPASVWCDFEDVRSYRDAVDLAKGILPVGVATLRIIKPGEMGFLRQIARLDVDAVLVRNLGSLSYLRAEMPGVRLVGDFSLNAANELTADLLLSGGLERLVPSYDLNWQQLQALARRSRPEQFELVVHQHLPMFHMEHCIFAALLSDGKDWRDCGRPCDHHQIELRDRVGAPLPVLADTGCRNTVYNAVAQSAAEYLPRMRELGIRHFRVELLREEPRDAIHLLNRYAGVLAGKETGRNTWQQLQVLNQLGVTRGTLQLG